MSKLTKEKIELIKKFAVMFDCTCERNGVEITLEQAIDIFNGEVPQIKNIEERRLDFIETIKPFVIKYGPEMLNKFYKYWSVNEGNKMRYEKQNTWDISQRLVKWHQNDIEYQRKRYIQELNRKM